MHITKDSVLDLIRTYTAVLCEYQSLSYRSHTASQRPLHAIPKAESADNPDQDPSEEDLSEFDRIGFASGIYYSKFATQVLDFAQAQYEAGLWTPDALK